MGGFGDVAGAETRQAVLDVTRSNLRRIMERMGFPEAEVAAAVESVRVVASEDGEALVGAFDAPERVTAYIGAVQAHDFERASLIFSAREG